MPLEAVLFDLFDTLLLLKDEDFYYPLALKRLYDALASSNIDIPYEDFKRVYFDVRERIYAEAFRTLEEHHFNFRVSQTLKELGFSFEEDDEVVRTATMAFADELKQCVTPDIEAYEVLENLHGRYKLGLITNFGIPEMICELLERYRWRAFFDVVLISAAENRRKPAPDIFRKALHLLNVEPSRSVFVGDRLEMDVKGAKGIGMKAILIERRPVENVEVKPDAIVSSLKGLLHILEDPDPDLERVRDNQGEE